MGLNPRLTQKEVKRSYRYCIWAYYGSLQNLLKRAEKVGHTERVEGWGADVFQVNYETCIVTGYAPFGNIQAPSELCKKYDKLADDAFDEYYYHREYSDKTMAEYNDCLRSLVNAFCEEVIKGVKR